MKNKRTKILPWFITLFLIIAITIVVVILANSSDNAESFLDKPWVIGKITDYDSMTIEEILDADESLTWVFTGDSITHNTSFTQGMNGYAEWFEQYLYDIGRNKDAVINSAWGGSDIADFQTQENTEDVNGTREDFGMGIENFITKYNPDVVFIKLGMNDRDQTTKDFVRRYKSMLTSIYEIGEESNKIPKIVVISPTPISGENYYDDEAPITPSEGNLDSTLRIRNALEDIVKEGNLGGYNILFSDFRNAFLEEGVVVGDEYHRLFFTSSSDGAIHPNAVGQYLMFKTLSKTLGIYNEKMPIYQITYDDISKAALYEGESVINKFKMSGTNYRDALAQNSVWIVAGAQQMSGYEGPVVNRSILRLLENALRGKGGAASYRDIRIVSAAAPDNTPEYLDANFEEMIGKHETLEDNTVFMLLPEVPTVYENGYDHETQLATYKASLESLMKKSTADVKILWTPLASNDTAINGYLADYAQVVRDIATANDAKLFDAYEAMNTVMADDASVSRNWFDNNGYISPLGAVDIAYAFVKNLADLQIATGELIAHNLRESSDERLIKGNYVRDYYEALTSVDGSKVTLDVSAVMDAYGLEQDALTLALLPYAGTGNYNENILDLEDVTSVSYADKKFTFEAPCSDLNIAIYATVGEKIYRFKDVALIVDTDATIKENTPSLTSAALDSLEIVGAPAFELADKQEVTLYQYQRYVQVCATAQKGLKITVTYIGKDGAETKEVIGSGKYSSLIPVKKSATIKVTVSGKINGENEKKTYQLDLTRPDYPDIIITEVMQNGWVEVYNASGQDLNLLDYSIGYKIDYPYTSEKISKGEWPYYFTGNNQAFQSTSSACATYTGINPITKYSSLWSGENTVGSEEVIFPADSTMVIWINADSASNLTSRVSALAQNVADNFFLENLDSAARAWLFILKKDATQATNGAITEVGNDIISASNFRYDSLSGLLNYNAERGMSFIKEKKQDTSTNLGTIEYWQKPHDLNDTTAPEVHRANIENGAIKLSISDNTDIRYIELNIKDADGNVTTITKDIVLETGEINKGITKDLKNYEYTYAVENSDFTFWGYVEDGNGNVTDFGNNR